MDFRRRATVDRGLRAVFLPDGDRRQMPDAVDVGLLFEELPGVGGQRFHISSLAFGVDRIEGERRFARSAHTGDDDQAAKRQRDVDVLEVVRAGAAHDKVSGFGSPGGWGIEHARYDMTGPAGPDRMRE